MSKKTRVIISVTNDLVTDQRVNKVATTLINNNFDVLMIGRKLKNSQEINRAYQTKRIKLLFNKGALFYAEYNLRLFFVLLFTKFDILNSNDLDTLTANYYAAKLKGKKIDYDSHEFFTEVPELVNRPKVRKIWLSIEKHILPKIKKSCTVSDGIAVEYKNRYGIEMAVIKNFPRKIIVEKANNEKEEKIIIYQGALNLKRGIDKAIKCMQYIDNVKLMIVGTGDVEDELKSLTKKLNLNSKVEFTGRIPFENLMKITSKADLGISIEDKAGDNYNFGLPNKLFDYINAEIPVLVASLNEMLKIINKYKVGEIAVNDNPKDIAKQMLDILNSEEKLKEYSENCKKAKEELCWENQEKTLLELYK
jgi:glycosyltransferase involved in cell wall biosynthesis